MALPAIGFTYLGQVYSPLSGLPAEVDDDGANQSDPTLLFVYYGMAGEWDYVSPRFPDEVTRIIDNLAPDEVADNLEIDGAIMLVVNTDWGGVNYYAFAPADSEISFTDRIDFAENAAE